MARSAEKAMATLSRWTTMMNNEDKDQNETKRPFLSSECESVKEAEKWLHQIIREVSKKVAQIQNAGMGEFRLRDLNDEINKLLREKRHWEDRILELGGPNYAKIGPKMFDKEGKEVAGSRGYKYFGAAKDLPGVRELFEQEPPKAVRKTRFELSRNINADYYGYRDKDDGVLVKLESEIGWKARAKAVAEYQKKKEAGQIEEEDEEEDDIYTNGAAISGEDDEEMEDADNSGLAGEGESRFVAHVPVPTQRDVEGMLIRRKKQELLDRYASDVLRSLSDLSKTLLGPINDS